MMNKQMKLPEIQKIMMEFEKQTEMMDMKEEMMSDAIDDAMGDEDDEEESDAIVTQVLDELGLQLTDELTAVPAPASGSLAPAGKAGADKAAPVAVGADGSPSTGLRFPGTSWQSRSRQGSPSRRGSRR